MPILAVLHLAIALFFAVHAARSGQPLYWLFILFAFPALGSIVYFVVVYLPDSRLHRGARKAVVAASKAIDPTRELRDAQAAYDYTPTAQNQMRLAAAQLEAGRAEEAAFSYEACLKGPFAADLEIRIGAARAYFACGRSQDAITHLEFIRANDPNFRAEETSLLLAQAFAAAGRPADARREFESALQRFGSFETKAEYVIWAAAAGEHDVASRLKPELQRAMERWTRHTRDLNKPLVRRLNEAYAAIRADGS
jgi:hypothetical protein